MKLISKFKGNTILYTDMVILLLGNIQYHRVNYLEKQKPSSNHFITA